MTFVEPSPPVSTFIELVPANGIVTTVPYVSGWFVSTGASVIFVPDQLASLYLGQVATRAGLFPTGWHGSATKCNSRSGHFARDDITSLQVMFPNFWLKNHVSVQVGTVGVENASGDVTITASIEYPAGTFTQLLFSGTAQATILSGLSLLSDAVSVSIPNGAQFWVRSYRTGAVGTMLNIVTSNYAGLALGDGLIINTVTTDLTLGGTITTTTAGYYPSAIIAQTRKPSIYCHGDSKCAGVHDTADASGDAGEITRSIGPYFAYINAGVGGDTVTEFNASCTNRLALAAYCSHFIGNGCGNDLTVLGKTAAQAEAAIQTLLTNIGNKPRYYLTTAPVTSGAWTLADLSDQTLGTANGPRVAVNTYLRTVPAPLTGVFETADVAESARDSGKWKADGTVSKYTNDGLHWLLFSYLLIQSSGAINPALFQRP